MAVYNFLPDYVLRVPPRRKLSIRPAGNIRQARADPCVAPANPTPIRPKTVANAAKCAHCAREVQQWHGTDGTMAARCARGRAGAGTRTRPARSPSAAKC